MSIKLKYKENDISVGDRVRVIQKIKEGDKKRLQAFEGILISIKGSKENKSITIRRIGEARIGIERIFPVASPTIESIETIKQGGRGVRRSKLYYIRDKSRKEIEKIYSRYTKKEKQTKNTSIATSEKIKNTKQ